MEQEQKFVFSCIEANDIPKMDFGGKSDPFVIIELLDQDDQKPFKTQTISNTTKPVWNEDGFFIIKDDYSQTVKFTVYDEDIKNHDEIGSFTINMNDVDKKLNGVNDEWIDIQPSSKVKKGKKAGKFHIKYCITDIEL